MRIGIDASPLATELTGVGTYLKSLLESLLFLHPQDHFFLYAPHSSPVLDALKKYPAVTIRLNKWGSFSQALWSQTTLACLSFRDQLDWFWGVTQSLPLFTRKGQKNLLTIHDFAYCLYPHTVSWARGIYLRSLSRWIYRKADCLTTNSEGTKARLKTLYGLEADQVIIPPLKKELGPPGPSHHSLLASYGLVHKGYVLMVGTLEPRKNIEAVLEAYPFDSPYPLVLVGKKGWRDKSIQQALTQYVKQLYLLGYLPDADLTALIGGARYFLMPSLYEGYGMPLAEARVCQTEVICSAVPEMIEATEGEAYLLSGAHMKEELKSYLALPYQAGIIRCHYPPPIELAKKLSALLKA